MEARRILRQGSLAAAAGVLILCTQADATVVTLGTGTVTLMEATYMPGIIVFKISSGDTNCPAGKVLTYSSSNADNTKTAYATLLANMLSGRQVYVYYDNANYSSGPLGASACVVTNVGTN
jgi:hypothetical protein